MTTFVKITNKDIYNKLNEFFESNRIEHKVIEEHLIKTNGKVKLNRWMATTAITLVVALTIAFIGKL